MIKKKKQPRSFILYETINLGGDDEIFDIHDIY